MADPLSTSHSLRHLQPLKGLRVLDMTRLLPGPLASLGLADLGAQVDKLEDPAPGDYLRHMPPMCGDTGAIFEVLNRDKRSLVVDLKRPGAGPLLLRLVARYDVVLEGFRPGVLARLGVSHEAMLAANPGLIIVAITGYGQSGPLAHRAGHDLNYLARAGVLGATGPAGHAPAVSGAQMADVAGGAQWAISAVLAGVIARSQSGRGCVADIAMCEASLPLGAFALGAALGGAPLARGESALDGGLAAYNTYLTADGHAMSLGALEPKFWSAFALALDLDPSLDALVAGPHQVALKAAVAARFRAHDRAHWVAFAAAHDCCLEPVLGPDELADDPHHQARALFFSVGDDAPVTYFRTPLGPGPAAPHHRARPAGADTRAVFAEAGFSAHEIDAAVAAGVLYEADP